MSKRIIFDFDRTIGTLIVDWTKWRKDIRDVIYTLAPNSTIDIEDIRHANQNELIETYGADFREKLNLINELSEQKCVTDFIVNQTVLDYILSTNNELYCWSSNSRNTLDTYFGEMNIADRFKKVVSREDTYFLKPDAEGFSLIRDEGVPLEEYIFVGDSDADRIAAKKSGIRFMHVDDFDLKA